MVVTQYKHAYQAVALSQQMSHTPSADLILTYIAQGQCPLPMAGTTVQLNHSNVTCHFIKKTLTLCSNLLQTDHFKGHILAARKLDLNSEQ